MATASTSSRRVPTRSWPRTSGTRPHSPTSKSVGNRDEHLLPNPRSSLKCLGDHRSLCAVSRFYRPDLRRLPIPHGRDILVLHPDFGPLDGSSFQAFGPPGCANGPTPEPCRNISMTSIPSTIDHSGALNVKVACTISVGANAKGLYWPFVGSCGRLSPL
jgi:hypothetical protein